MSRNPPEPWYGEVARDWRRRARVDHEVQLAGLGQLEVQLAVPQQVGGLVEEAQPLVVEWEMLSASSWIFPSEVPLLMPLRPLVLRGRDVSAHDGCCASAILHQYLVSDTGVQSAVPRQGTEKAGGPVVLPRAMALRPLVCVRDVRAHCTPCERNGTS